MLRSLTTIKRGMTTQYFIQGDHLNDWWFVSDNKEHRVIDNLYKKNKQIVSCSDDKPNTVKVNYTVMNNNKPIEYTLVMEFFRPHDAEQGSVYDMNFFRFRKSNPNKRRKIEVVLLPDHSGARDY